MSSVSGSDRKRQNDEIRQLREDYESSEVETAKRNKSERKRANEVHQKEIARLKEDYNNNLDTLRNKHSEILTERDQAHQDQIEKVKGMYLEQVRRKTEENETARNEQRNAYESDMEKAKRVNEQQKDALTRNFKSSLQDREREFSDFQANAQEKMKASLDDRTSKLRERHERDLAIVSDDRDEKVAALQSQNAQVRDTSARELRDQQRKASRDSDRVSQHYQQILADQADQSDALLTNRNSLLKAEREAMRDKYRDSLDRKLDQLDVAHENLKAQVDGRMDTQVRSLAHQLQQSKSDRIVDAMNGSRLRSLEQKHLQQQTQDRLDDMERQVGESNQIANDRARARVGEALERTDKLLENSTRRHRLEQSLMAQQSAEGREQLQLEMKSRVDSEKDQADKRVRRIIGTTDEQMKTQQRYHDKNLDQLKASYSDNLVNQREAHMESLGKLRSRDQERLQEQMAKASKKLDETVSNYEAKIAKLQEDNQNDKARLIESYENRMAQREKALKTEQESQSIKYEAKLAQAGELRDKEMERLERRHQEQMANMANRVKYLSNKKA